MDNAQFDVVSIEFFHPLKGLRTVPLVDAWVFFEQHDYQFHPSMATIRKAGQEYKTFAKGWCVWDATMKRHRLTRIGLGAGGDGGPLNPARDVHGPCTGRYAGSGWVYAINWPTTDDR